jgi:sulfite reductase beta subunit-like hemoprotein
MTKMQVKLEKTTATMLYPKLTKVNVEAEFNRDVAKSEFNKLSDDQIEDKLIDALRGLAEEINQLSSSEDLDLYIGAKLQGGLELPTNDSPKDFIRKLLDL